jgi:hypothetical protein
LTFYIIMLSAYVAFAAMFRWHNMPQVTVFTCTSRCTEMCSLAGEKEGRSSGIHTLLRHPLLFLKTQFYDLWVCSQSAVACSK